jgi:predicted hotdog family 3-hydroxylacyl-ACP dehydratase
MLLLDEVISISESSAECAWTVNAQSRWHLADHGVPAWIGIEYMAQCIAVMAGARARALGLPPPLGFLLGTREYRCDIPWFLPGQQFTVQCTELVVDDNGLGAYRCEICSQGQAIALAVLTVYRASDNGEAMLKTASL